MASAWAASLKATVDKERKRKVDDVTTTTTTSTEEPNKYKRRGDIEKEIIAKQQLNKVCLY